MAKLAQIAEEVRGVLLVDLEEDVLEVRHRDAIRPDVELVKPGVQVVEEAAEVVRLRFWNNERDFFVDLACFLDALEVRLHVLYKTRMGLSALLDERDAIADAEAILEEERATNALQLTLHHDTDAVAQHISLVHVVRRQDDDAIFLVGLQHIPEVAPCT